MCRGRSDDRSERSQLSRVRPTCRAAWSRPAAASASYRHRAVQLSRRASAARSPTASASTSTAPMARAQHADDPELRLHSTRLQQATAARPTPRPASITSERLRAGQPVRRGGLDLAAARSTSCSSRNRRATRSTLAQVHGVVNGDLGHARLAPAQPVVGRGRRRISQVHRRQSSPTRWRRIPASSAAPAARRPRSRAATTSIEGFGEIDRPAHLRSALLQEPDARSGHPLLELQGRCARQPELQRDDLQGRRTWEPIEWPQAARQLPAGGSRAEHRRAVPRRRRSA